MKFKQPLIKEKVTGSSLNRRAVSHSSLYGCLSQTLYVFMQKVFARFFIPLCQILLLPRNVGQGQDQSKTPVNEAARCTAHQWFRRRFKEAFLGTFWSGCSAQDSVPLSLVQGGVVGGRRRAVAAVRLNVEGQSQCAREHMTSRDQSYFRSNLEWSHIFRWLMSVRS